MPGTTVVILAGGSGTRMHSALPKLAHDLCGQPLLWWSVTAAATAFPGSPPVVVVPAGDGLRDLVPGHELAFAVQAQPRGTADAVASAAEEIDRDATVIVLSGDVPLIEPELLRALADAHTASGAAATMVTVSLEDPSGYGRVLRDATGAFVRVVETKAPGDATAA